MKGSSFLPILVLVSSGLTNCQPQADHGSSESIKDVVDASVQDILFRDTPRNYDQKSIYRKTSPTSKKIALHNGIFKKAVANAIRKLGLNREEAYEMVKNELQALFGKHNRPKPGGFPGGQEGQNINNGVSLPFLPPPQCNEGEAIRCSETRYYSIDGTCNNLNNPRWGSTNSPLRRFEDRNLLIQSEVIKFAHQAVQT